MASLTINRDEPGVLRVAGELDGWTARELVAAGDREAVGVLDLSGVSFLDAAGLSALLVICDGGAVRVRAPSAIVQRVISLAGVAERFDAPADPSD